MHIIICYLSIMNWDLTLVILNFITHFSLTVNSSTLVLGLWCEPRDHVVTQPIIKIEIWSRKAERGLIGVWHNGNLSDSVNLR